VAHVRFALFIFLIFLCDLVARALPISGLNVIALVDCDIFPSGTGEHGIGYGKIKYLQQQYMGSATLEMMKLIKQSLDPENLMNPGKIIE
jgi:hypothetical protein